MAICPSCLTKQSVGVRTCPVDGTALVPEETFAHVDHDLAPGTIVGEYRIEAKIGQGGFGAVFRAVHPVIGKTAAVKVLGRHFSGNAAMVSRFIAEARAVNQIRHRNIIDIFAFGTLEDGRQYYVMELLDGMPFDRYLREHRRLSIAAALPILRGIARAIDAAHAKGILHRDLKPENVFLVFDEDGRVQPKLLDFGLVKLTSDAGANHKTKTGTPMGTPYYMSPEQCRGLDVDRRTDVYAFGAVIFEVLTGAVPFDGGSAMDVLVKHMTAAPPSASERCADLPPQVDEPIKRMLAKEPQDRPASLGEALDLVAQAVPADSVVETSAKAASASPPGAFGALANVATVMDDDSSSRAPVRVVAGQTFLDAEADVTPVTRPRSRVFASAVAVALALVGSAGAFVTFRHAPGAAPPQGARAHAPISPSDPDVAPVPSAAASAADPVPPANVAVRVVGAPPGATVAAAGKELGAAPGPFAMKNGVEITLTVAAKGYKAKDVAVVPTDDLVVPVSLEKVPAPKAPKAGKGSGLHSDLEGFDQK